MAEFNKDKYQAWLEKGRAQKWRKVAVLMMMVCAALAAILIGQIISAQRATEAARQAHIADLRLNIDNFRRALWHPSDDEMIERLQRENLVFSLTTRALRRHDRDALPQTSTIHNDARLIWSDGSAGMTQAFGRPFIRTDAPEVIRANNENISSILGRLEHDLESDRISTFDVFRLLTAAHVDINEFFHEHDAEAERIRRVEDVRGGIATLRSVAHGASQRGYLIVSDAIILMPFSAVDTALHRLYAHYGEEPAAPQFHFFYAELFSDHPRPTLLELIFMYDDNPAETAGMVAEMLYALHESISPDMDLRQIRSIITDTANEIQEIYDKLLRLARQNN